MTTERVLFDVVLTRSAECWMFAHSTQDEFMARIKHEIEVLHQSGCDVEGKFTAVMPWTRDQEEFAEKLRSSTAEDKRAVVDEPLFIFYGCSGKIVCDRARFEEVGKTDTGLSVYAPVGEEFYDIEDDEDDNDD